MQFEACLEKLTLGEEDDIPGVPGNSPEDMSAVHIHILDPHSLL
jgi:hypothetical protein